MNNYKVTFSAGFGESADERIGDVLVFERDVRISVTFYFEAESDSGAKKYANGILRESLPTFADMPAPISVKVQKIGGYPAETTIFYKLLE